MLDSITLELHILRPLTKIDLAGRYYVQARQRRLYFELQRTAHRLQKEADRELSGVVKMTTQQAAVLSVITNGEGNTQRAIALALGLNESAVTVMIERLTKYGYIKRQRSASDRRAYEITMTQVGKEAVAASRKGFAKINRKITSSLNDEEVDTLADLLSRLYEDFAPT